MFQNLNLKENKIVGVDDGRFLKSDKKALLFAVLMQEVKIMRLKIDEILVDGLDSTEVIKKMLSKISLDLIMLSGISFAGFNVVDIHKLNNEIKKPVIVITGEKPRSQKILSALKKHFQDWRTRWSIIKKAGNIHTITTNKKYKPIYYEAVGLDYKEAKKIICGTTIFGRYPEPIRVAKLIAKQLTNR